MRMSILSLHSLCRKKIIFDNDEIFEMELETLADMCLQGFSGILREEKADSYPLENFIGFVIPDKNDLDRNEDKNALDRNDFDVRCAISEAFQWLCNNGYIARLLLPESSQRYFITRSGKERLRAVGMQALEELGKEILADGEIPGPPNSGNSEDY